MDRRVVRRLRRKLSQDAVIVHLSDGSTRAFRRMDVAAELFLARLDASIGRPLRESEVLDALRNATPESRRTLEEIAEAADGSFDDLDSLGTNPPKEPVPELFE